MVIDATELGDLLPLAGAEYRVGAESVAETGEAHAQPHEAKAHCVQSFTYTFAAERRPEGERHVIAEPARYRHYRASPALLADGSRSTAARSTARKAAGWNTASTTACPAPRAGCGPIAACSRRRRSAARRTHDLALFNWPGNDYRDRSIIDRPAAEVAASLQDAKRVSLGFLHWLQTEAPATGDRRGAPEIMLRPDAMGTADGLSKHPYIRESRRIVALKTIVEQEVSAQFQAGPRGGTVRRFGGHRLVPDRHPSLRRRRRRPQLPDAAVPDSARRADPGAHRRTCRRPARTSARPTSRTAAIACTRSSGTSARRPARWRRSRCSSGLTPAAVRAERLAPFQQSLLDEGVPLAWPESLR